MTIKNGFNNPTNLFGNYMQDLRQGSGLTKEKIAALLGVSKISIERWESGTELPPKNLSSKISAAFKIKEAEWLECFEFELSNR